MMSSALWEMEKTTKKAENELVLRREIWALQQVYKWLPVRNGFSTHLSLRVTGQQWHVAKEAKANERGGGGKSSMR